MYGAQKALDNVSFSAQPGEIIGLLGPNGAGKTTTMKILTCFIPASEGLAKVCGYDVNEDHLEVRRHIGYLPEHNPLYKEMYVKEYLELIARIFKIQKPSQRISDLIEMTGLTKEQSKKIQFLSKGYRQRVGLAQAMMHDPEVLILDEPTSGLDPNQLLEIRSLIRELGKEKLVLFSSHIMQEVQALCDRVIILDNGKLVTDDRISTLVGSSAGNYRMNVLFKNKMDDNKLLAIDGVEKVEQEKGNSYFIYFDAEKNVSEDIFDLTVKEGNKILRMAQEDKSIESVFQKITSKKNKS